MARGSVRRADSAWGHRVDAGLDPANGKRRQLSKQGFRNKRDAETALNAVLRGLEDGSTPRRSSTTLGDFLDEWLEVQRQRIRPTTWHGYEMAVERIKRHLGKAKLQALSPLQIEKLYSMLLDSGRSGGGALAAKTVRNTHVVLRKALADAKRRELVHRNAAGTAKAPSRGLSDDPNNPHPDVRLGADDDRCVWADNRNCPRAASSVCPLPSI